MSYHTNTETNATGFACYVCLNPVDQHSETRDLRKVLLVCLIHSAVSTNLTRRHSKVGVPISPSATDIKQSVQIFS
jgi:hypothetical protein